MSGLRALFLVGSDGVSSTVITTGGSLLTGAFAGVFAGFAGGALAGFAGVALAGFAGVVFTGFAGVGFRGAICSLFKNNHPKQIMIPLS